MNQNNDQEYLKNSSEHILKVMYIKKDWGIENLFLKFHGYENSRLISPQNWKWLCVYLNY